MAITYRQGHEGRLSVEEMDGNFHYVEDYLTGLTNSVASLTAFDAGLSASLVALAALEHLDVAGLTASVMTLNTNLASATASIGTLNTNLASATASIGTLNTNVASATASIATLNTNVASATASIGTLNTNLASATASIGTLNTNLASATASIASINTILASATASTVSILKKTITSAEILTSYTAPVELIPAPGSGKLLLVQSAIIRYIPGGSTYSTNIITNIRYGNALSLYTNPNSLGQSSENAIITNMLPSTTTSAALPTNSPLLFQTSNGNPTAGDGTIYLYLTYTIVTL